ncbi:general transcription factor 3C polypeptide 2 isoform X2 [Salminus brasiliensis]|uniref:general transcription factor 3C polypeptide 2 isoform X2 n=1 Tax=Salminus brasiliensis TaxID=930266 RepID=UPI003B833EBF
MAAAAPEVDRPTEEFMGLPYEKDEGNQIEQINHTDAATNCNLNGDALILRNGEPRALDCDSSEMSIRPGADSNLTTFSLQESQQEMSEVYSCQLSSNDDQAALPPENKKQKRGRPRKSKGYVRESARSPPASKIGPKKVPRSKTPGKKMLNYVTEPCPQSPPQSDSPAIPESPEMTPSGRPKRRAAKAALEYLHSITKDLEHSDKPSTKKGSDSPVLLANSAHRNASGRETERKRKAPNNNQCDDVDFDPEGHEDVESEEDEGDEEYGDPMLGLLNKKTSYKHKLAGGNGLSSSAMQPLWESFRSTIKFRQEHCSSWVFSEWIPSVSDWHLLSTSEVGKYLPLEEESVTFTLSREGIKEQSFLRRMKRFESLPPHVERWDSLFFVGGPVWAMEWCPCPEGAAETQYVALSCNKGMDDRHKINLLYTEHSLLQLWDLGKLQMSRPSSSPSLAYALAVDDGCIWNLKWCPAGAWELPTTDRKTPHMPRLGLMAAAFSNGTLAVYSLPHPEALKAQNRVIGESSQSTLIYRVGRIMTVKLGSSQANHNGQSGQCFALDWLPVKPHNILAAGFYDGTVALWDLSTKSSLQRVKSPDKSLCLYPYHCFLAHDHTVRSLSWCGASSELLVTVGDDRMVKLWNMTNTCVPLKAMKRFLPTEVSWPTFWSGVFITQECCFSALGQQGLHYLDSGYFGHKPFFVCTRKSTVWSFSMSDWMNSCVVGDNMGDCVCSLLCDPDCNYSNSRRHRFPVYRTELAQFGPDQRRWSAEAEEEEEDVGVVPERQPQSYRGATKTYYLHFHDMDLRSFTKYQDKPIMKQLHTSETKGILFVDQMPLNALYKVRFNPNMDAHGWVLSAGQSGLVRAHCVKGLSGPSMRKVVCEAQEQFTAMFRSEELVDDATTIRHFTADTVQVR